MKNRIVYIISMLIFGSIGIFVKKLSLPSLTVAFYRAAIASIFLFITGMILKRKKLCFNVKGSMMLLAVSGAAIGLNWFFLFQAYKFTTIANATISYYFAPVFVLLLSPLVLKEKLTPVKILCTTAAFLGLIFILGGAAGNGNSNINNLKGIFLGLTGALLYAGIVLANKFVRNVGGLERTTIQMISAAVVLLPLAYFTKGFDSSIFRTDSLVIILILGILHTGIAYLLYFSSISNIRAGSAAILSYIDPVSAVIFASVFLKEGTGVFQILGGALILGASMINELKDSGSIS